MKHHWNYFKYVMKHKYFVFKAGRKLKVPLWQLVIHDWSKFTRSEWTPYVHSFYTYKDDRTPEIKAAFDVAWLHHIHKNPHHWQHWILLKDDGEIKKLEMPSKFVVEMIADWMGAGRAITGRWEVNEWYERNKNKIMMNAATRSEVEFLLESMKL